MKFKSEKYSGNGSQHHDHITGSRDPGVHLKKDEQRVYETKKSLEFHSLSSLA